VLDCQTQNKTTAEKTSVKMLAARYSGGTGGDDVVDEVQRWWWYRR